MPPSNAQTGRELPSCDLHQVREAVDQRQDEDGDHFGCKCCCCSCSSLRRCCCSCRSCSGCSSIWCCSCLFAVHRDRHKNHPWLVHFSHLTQLRPCLARIRWAGGGCGGSFLSVSQTQNLTSACRSRRQESGVALLLWRLWRRLPPATTGDRQLPRGLFARRSCDFAPEKRPQRPLQGPLGLGGKTYRWLFGSGGRLSSQARPPETSRPL